MPSHDWIVICFCAEWCGTCREYKSIFKSLADEYRHIRFGWLDIEDEAIDLDGLDLETFPTILIAQGQCVRFMGALQPYAYNLRQLLSSMQLRSGESSDDKLTLVYQFLIPKLMAQPKIFL